MKQRIFCRIIIMTCSLAAFAGDVSTSESTVDEEISRVRRELLAVQNQRDRTREEIAKDKSGYAAYVEKARVRFSRMRAEIDSVRQNIKNRGHERDSITALGNEAENRKKNYLLMQENFQKRIIETCDRLLTRARALPPLIRKNFEGSIAFLRNDLSTKASDNIEGITRFFQISRDMQEVSATVQISQDQPPVAGLRGACSGIRLGAIFEAMVDAKGEKAAVWTGNHPDQTPRWRLIENPAAAADIQKAIAIREGKALPGFVTLPLVDNPAVAEGAKK